MIVRARKVPDGVGDGGDLLSMLLASRDDETDHSGMTDEQLRDEVLTIFLAGYETVANALSWTWLLLGQNPEAEAKLHAEIDSVLGGRLPTLEDLPQLRYAEMVLAESMRLYPPAWAMGRQATCDVEIGPYKLPAGTYIFFSQYIIQRNARLLSRSAALRSRALHAGAQGGTSALCLLPIWRRQPSVHRRVVRVDGSDSQPGDAGAALAVEACSRPENWRAAEDYAASEICHSRSARVAVKLRFA